MSEAGLNVLRLEARLTELLALRRTPAGVPVVGCTLTHESKQIEADIARDVSVEIPAVALGELANVLAAAAPGMRVAVTGFLAAKSLRSKTPVLHLNKIEFLEGN